MGLPLSALQRSELLEQLLTGVTGGEVASALTGRFDPRHQVLLVVGPGGAESDRPSAEELLRLHAAVMDRDPGQAKGPTVEVPLLEPRPRGGAVSDRVEAVDEGVVSVTLDNGVLVHLRSMDRHPGRVLVHVGLAGGRILGGLG